MHHPGVATVAITSVTGTSIESESDELSVEEPLEIRVNLPGDGRPVRRSLAVTMRTPGNDVELAAGFLFTEGVIRDKNEIAEIRATHANVVEARLAPTEKIEPGEQPDEEFDLHLNNGNLLEHFHEGNMTYRVEGIRRKTPDVFVEVSHELAKERGIQSGTRVELVSRYGQVFVRALVTDRVHGKQLFMPMNSAESPVNRLIGSHTDAVTHTPAYKEASVRMRVLPEVGESPLPRINHRFGQPTPQRGVEIERKWKRADYSVPGIALVQLQIGNNKE